ncbi:MAG: hypothetical protein CUN54_04355 [Phototrophicales bacterium]|nr:MAG: hypothetical protein CUN54_04355 [Phototrophicales bacterium]
MRAKIYGFDFPQVVEYLQKENEDVKKFESIGRLRLIPGHLPWSLDNWISKTQPSIDIALVDARHEYPDVWMSLNSLWPCLSPHGYVLCHDYSDAWPGVQHAIDDFAKRSDVMALSFAPASSLVALRKRPSVRTLRSVIHHRYRTTLEWKWTRSRIGRWWFNRQRT